MSRIYATLTLTKIKADPTDGLEFESSTAVLRHLRLIQKQRVGQEKMSDFNIPAYLPYLFKINNNNKVMKRYIEMQYISLSLWWGNSKTKGQRAIGQKTRKTETEK